MFGQFKILAYIGIFIIVFWLMIFLIKILTAGSIDEKRNAKRLLLRASIKKDRFRKAWDAIWGRK